MYIYTYVYTYIYIYRERERCTFYSVYIFLFEKGFSGALVRKAATCFEVLTDPPRQDAAGPADEAVGPDSAPWGLPTRRGALKQPCGRNVTAKTFAQGTPGPSGLLRAPKGTPEHHF